MPQMNSKTKSIGEIFTGISKFEVPKHQRDYSWTDIELDEFFNDITSSMSKQAKSYYIGMIVFVVPDRPSNRYQILDGQQRLTTISIIISAARDWCRQNGFDDAGNRMQSEFIGFSDYGQKEHDPRMILNSNNRDIFEKVIVNASKDEKPESLSKTNLLLLSAYEKAQGLLSQFLSAERKKQDKERRVYEMVKYIRDSVQATVLEVNDPEDAYTIFESLNDRGLELSIFDLLKNHVYRELGANKETIVTSLWNRLSANLRERKTDEFIRIFWIIRHGRVQKGTLFTKIKEKYSGNTHASTLIKSMVEDSEIYSAIDSADGEVWAPYSDSIKKNIRSISILGGNQSRPILLAAIKANWKEADLRKLTAGLIALIVRHQIIGRERTGALEIFCADLSYEIFAQKTLIAVILQKIRDFYPDDTKFRNDFISYQETRAQRAKYFLSEIEYSTWKESNPNSALEFTVCDDIDAVNIEHIFPKKYESNQAWLSHAKAHKALVELVNNLGNQCLIAKGPNGKVGNKDFAAKKIVYGRSAIPTTKAISKISDWIPEEILKRQQTMAAHAAKIWKV